MSCSGSSEVIGLPRTDWMAGSRLHCVLRSRPWKGEGIEGHQFVPFLGITLSSTDSPDSFTMAHLGFADPNAASETLAEAFNRFSDADGYEMRILAKPEARVAMLSKPRGRAQCQVELVALKGERTVSIANIEGYLQRDKKAGRRLWAKFGRRLLVAIPIPGIPITCWALWVISGGLLWTKCIGGCSVWGIFAWFLSCQCYSTDSWMWRTSCGGFRPCR